TTNEIISQLHEMDFTKFTHTHATEFEKEYLYNYLRELIKEKTGNVNTTFHDLQNIKSKLQFKDLYVFATKLFFMNGQPEAQIFIFSHEHTPHTRIADALRASAALPLIFSPIRLKETEKGKYVIHPKGHIYVDGGIVEANPIRVFDH